MSRRRSAASIETDERLLDAALDELTAVGVDRMGMIGVARRAGLTTGALYGRYENVDELAADVWHSRARAPMFGLLDDAVAALLDGGDPKALVRVLEVLQEPPREISAGIELMVCARRIDELEELVAPDVEEWLRRHRASLRARDQRHRAQVLFAAGSVVGMLLYSMPGGEVIEAEPALTVIRQAFARAYERPDTRFAPVRIGQERSALGDPYQDALIDAVAAITARVGFERATASRIARRANLTSGAIYARYQTKDELLREAVDVLLTRRFVDALSSNTHLLTRFDAGTTIASVVAGLLGAARREWRIFRVEAQLASRYRPQIATTLDRVQKTGFAGGMDLLRATTGGDESVIERTAHFMQAMALGLIFIDVVLPGGASVDWRPVFVPLFTMMPKVSG
jgi:AcrR family transcriptional regulator